jgi:hypothetical protein
LQIGYQRTASEQIDYQRTPWLQLKLGFKYPLPGIKKGPSTDEPFRSHKGKITSR